MFTLEDCKQQVLSLIDEYSVDGQLIGADENSDYTLRVPQFANKVQIEVAKLIKIPSVYKITQNFIPNQLGLIFGFDLYQHKPDIGDYILSAKGTQSYYFEVDNVSTVYIEELVGGVWTLLKTIDNTAKGEFTAYKGNLTLTSVNNEVRIRFSGNYVYNIRNTAMFQYLFPTDDDVPTYKPYTFYDMPSDFMDLDKIIQEGNERTYRETQQFYWENRKILRLNYYDQGSFDIHYFKYPTKIDANTLDTYEFEVYEEAAQLIPFKVASMIIQTEKADVSSRLLQIYETDLSRVANGQVTEPQVVQSIYAI